MHISPNIDLAAYLVLSVVSHAEVMDTSVGRRLGYEHGWMKIWRMIVVTSVHLSKDKE